MARSRCTDEHARRLDGVDPLAGLRPREVRALARRAHGLHHRRRAGALEDLSNATEIPLRRLRMLADAWAEAGPSGVDAMGPAVDTPRHLMALAEEALDEWRARHFPLELLRWDVWRNRITVWWVVPNADRAAAPQRRPLLQLRLTHEGRWHLYRRASAGEWWPVTVRGPRRPQGLTDCLDVVTADAANRFWHASVAHEASATDPTGRDRG